MFLRGNGMTVSGWTVQTCAPTLCGGGVCEAAHTRGVAVWFEGYVASLDGLMEQSLVFIAPRLAGVSPGFNSCVAVVVGWFRGGFGALFLCFVL